MSLIICKECKKDVSDKSSKCPHCGCPVRKKTSFLTWFIALFFVFVIARVIINKSSAPSIDVPASPAPAVASSINSTPPPAATAIPMDDLDASDWSWEKNTDLMTNKIVITAQTNSNNSHDLHPPYGNLVRATLVIRNHPRYGKDVLMKIDRGQILCKSYSPCTVLVKFDEKPPVKFTGTGPSDHSTETVFINGAFSRFISESKKSKKATIEVPLFQDGQLAWEFDIRQAPEKPLTGR